LKWYDEIFECIRAQFGEYIGIINNMENIFSLLLNITESLNQEKHKSFTIEQTMAMIMQRTETLEQEVRKF